MKKVILKTLKWSERYTKTDMRYLARNGFWVSSGYAVQVVIGIITTVALANLLPKETLGTYQFILSIAGILSVITLSGIGPAITRAVAQGKEGAFRAGAATKLKWSIGIVLSSGIVSTYYFFMGNDMLGSAFLIVGAFAPIIESAKLYEPYLQGKEAFKDTLILGFWRKPLPMVAILATLYFTDDVLTLVLVYFATNALSYALVYWAVLRKYNPPKESDADTVHQGIHLSVLRIVGQLKEHGDKIIIWHFLGPVAVASFVIAQLSIKYSGGLINTLSSLVLPKVSRRDLPTLQSTLPRKIFLFSGVMAIGSIIFILIVPFIFPLLFPTYSESIPLAQVLAITMIFMPSSAIGKTFIAHQKIKEQYIVGIGSAIILLTLAWFLTSTYGVWGAVYALVAGNAIIYLFTLCMFKLLK